MEQEGVAPDTAGDNDDANTRFYLFVGGYGATSFDMNAPPNLVVHQGTVEDWILTNTTAEDHVFHIHQFHFQVLEINGQPVQEPAIRDTINIPHMSGSGPPPSLKVRMDFRGANLMGTFV
jgi:FtsP/CotA-like multicopper oxidase with cupredoxin domain